jgi:dTDP-4-amino-4,6-dideoxygalactose transaminase
MLDLKAEYRLLAEEVRAAVEEVLASGHYIGGPAVAAFEEAMARRIGTTHAIAVSSGTDAILCVLMALGIGPGDEVIGPSFTFFATAGCVARLGATPVFVDIDARTFNVDPAGIEAAITPRTKALMPVHLYGQCADMDPIAEIARRRGLAVIEDAAQAIGAGYKGRYAGTLGDAACLSFYPTKNLGGFGEGGMILTDDDKLASLCRQLRTHGESQRYHHDRVGGNFRLDALKAAILRVKLNYLDRFTRRRREIARQYDESLGTTSVAVPLVPPGHEPVYHQYTVQSDRRDPLQQFLQERDVASAVYYPVPLHVQKCFEGVSACRAMLPVTEKLSERVLSLPCHPMMTDEDVAHVASCVRRFDGASQAAGGRCGNVGSSG